MPDEVDVQLTCRLLPAKVWVAVYEHQHGTEIFAYATEALAEAARQRIAEDWWDYEVGNKPMPDDRTQMADAYFEAVSGYERFTVEECNVIGYPER